MAQQDTVVRILEQKGSKTFSVDPDASVFSALEVMAARDVGAVLVMRGTELRGIFSERDYARKGILHGKMSKETKVGEVMSGDPVTVSPTHTVADCMRFMSEFRVRHLPVVEDGAVIGVVSIGDIVNWTIRGKEEEISHLHQYIGGSYPA